MKFCLTAAALLFGQATTAVSATTTTAKVDFPDPNLDPFYSVPSHISDLSPGHIIRSRPVTTTVTGDAIESHQYLYATTDQEGCASATVGTVWLPHKPASPPKIFSLQLPEDSVNIDCAPSWAWANASSTNEPYFQADNPILISWALKQGYYVVTPDFEGPNAAWLVGRNEGRAVLDGIRGVINFLDLQGAEAVLYGYSGGAHASVWASTLAEEYAPEVEIVGAAFGGTPVDLRHTVPVLSGGANAYLAVGAFAGLANGYPGFNASLYAHLTEHGVATMNEIKRPNHCITAVGAQYAGVNLTTLFRNDTDPLSIPAISDVFDRESLLDNTNPSAVPVPKFPRFEWHGTADATVPYEYEAQYVKQQCDKGADIRFVSLDGLDHDPAYYAGIPGSLRFIREVFEKELDDVTCGQNVSVPAIGSQESVDVMGSVYDSALKALLAGM